MKFENFEAAALIGAAAAGLVAGEQPKADKPDTIITKPTNEQVVLTHHQKTEKQMDVDGREYLMIDGAKFYLEPERVDMKVTSPKIESTGGVVLQSDKEEENIRFADTE